jgi:hypothetical protein
MQGGSTGGMSVQISPAAGPSKATDGHGCVFGDTSLDLNGPQQLCVLKIPLVGTPRVGDNRGTRTMTPLLGKQQ